MRDPQSSAMLAAVLRGLADGRPIEEIDLSPLSDGDPVVAEALAELAGRIAGLRRRGTELRALMSSTKDLLSTRDTTALLQRIVEQSHDLLDVDVAYLSVYEPATDELVVRAQTGTISSRFAGMVVPAGIGLASKIVHTRQPQSIDDYRQLDSVPRDRTIDQIVAEENLHAMMGTPLVVEDQVLGVLFAAGRETQAFRAEEVALLSAFAGHAALVLHVARLLTAATQASAEATRRQQQAEWAAALHAELTNLVVLGHSAGDIVDALATALRRPVALTTTRGEAMAGPTALAEAARTRTDAAARAQSSGRGVFLAEGEIEFIAPVPAGLSREGFLVVGRAGVPMSDVERRTVERSALTVAVVVLRRDALSDAEERVRGELAAELLESPSSRRSALRRGSARGLPVDDPWSILVVPVDTGHRTQVLRRLREASSRLATKIPRGVVVFEHGADAVTAAQDILERLGDTASLVIAGAHDSLADAAASTDQTRRVARLALGLGLTGAVDVDLLAPYALLAGDDADGLLRFVSATLAPVVDWDRERGAALFDTLAVLQDERWGLSAAARRLHIHLNTLKQRVKRLQGLLGPDVDGPEGRFRLELAVRMERARRALQKPVS